MSAFKIEDFRFSSSSIDDFFTPIRTAGVSSGGKIRVSNTHQLSGFQVVSGDKLIHLSQQDFWKLGQDNEGFFIERLVEDDISPVKG